jgi:sugar diacid utilization regulator
MNKYNDKYIIKMSLTKTKLYNSIYASKIEIDYNDIENSIKKIKKQLSLTNKRLPRSQTEYNMEALYLDNTNDKYEFCSKK